MLAILDNLFVRAIVAAVLVFVGLQVHMSEWGMENMGAGIVFIYALFILYAWAGAEFKTPFLGKAFIYALPDVFIPPIILLPLRNTLDSIQISWLIGIAMTIYSSLMLGWMIAAYRKAQASGGVVIVPEPHA